MERRMALVIPSERPRRPRQNPKDLRAGKACYFRTGTRPDLSPAQPRDQDAITYQQEIELLALLKQVYDTAAALSEAHGEHTKEIVADRYDYWPGHVNPGGVIGLLARLSHPSPDDGHKHPPACLDAIRRDLPRALAYLKVLDKALRSPLTAIG